MAHHYNVCEVLSLTLGVWVASPMIVLIWLACPALINRFKRRLILWRRRHSHTIIRH